MLHKMVQIYTIDSFDREFKRLAKKYASLRADLGQLIKQLYDKSERADIPDKLLQGLIAQAIDAK